jgi:hypothetical protein
MVIFASGCKLVSPEGGSEFLFVLTASIPDVASRVLEQHPLKIAVPSLGAPQPEGERFPLYWRPVDPGLPLSVVTALPDHHVAGLGSLRRLPF